MKSTSFPRPPQPPIPPQGSLVDDIRRIQAAHRRAPVPRGIIGPRMVVIPKTELTRLKEREALLQVELQLTQKKVATLEGEKAQLQRDHQDFLEMFCPPWRE